MSRSYRRDGLCGRCGVNPKRETHRWCASCHAANMREKRTAYADLPDAAKVKARARTAVKNALTAGALTKAPCAVCRETSTVAHHHDYAQPLNVTWLCAPHHHWVHAMLREAS